MPLGRSVRPTGSGNCIRNIFKFRALLAFGAETAEVVIDIFQKAVDALDGAEHKQHPERVQQHEKDDDGEIEREGRKDARGHRRCSRGTKAGVDHVEQVHKPEEEDHD